VLYDFFYIGESVRCGRFGVVVDSGGSATTTSCGCWQARLSVSDVIDFRLGQVTTQCWLCSEVVVRAVYVDYYFYDALGASDVYLVVINCAVVSSSSLTIAACGSFRVSADVSVKD